MRAGWQRSCSCSTDGLLTVVATGDAGTERTLEIAQRVLDGTNFVQAVITAAPITTDVLRLLRR